jgi:hypothetical protein
MGKRSRQLEHIDLDVQSSPDSNEPAVDLASPPAAKYAELDIGDSQTAMTALKCHLPPHRDVLSFKSYEEYESHYAQNHTNRCLECKKNFPSEHLLSVHIEECHDSFVAVKRERGEHTVGLFAPNTTHLSPQWSPNMTQYSCFVEGCERKCLTHQKRRLHLIDKHMYPKNFFFSITKDGIDGRESLLVEGGQHRRRSSGRAPARDNPPRLSDRTEADATKDEGEIDGKHTQSTGGGKPPQHPQDAVDVEMDNLAGAMSALQFVPSSIRFGRGGRMGFPKK